MPGTKYYMHLELRKVRTTWVAPLKQNQPISQVKTVHHATALTSRHVEWNNDCKHNWLDGIAAKTSREKEDENITNAVKVPYKL